MVTGESASGKSALLEVIRYCLGSGDFRIPEGVIAGSVAWYALRLRTPGGEALVARPRPQHGRATTTDMFLRLGRHVSTPALPDLVINANVDSVRGELGRLIGIAENASPIPAGASRPELEAI